MVAHDVFMGGALELTFGANTPLTFNPQARFIKAVATVGSLTLSLPTLDDTHLPVGQNMFTIANFGVANSFTVADVDSLGFSFVVPFLGTLSIASYVAASGGSPVLGHKWMGFARTALV